MTDRLTRGADKTLNSPCHHTADHWLQAKQAFMSESRALHTLMYNIPTPIHTPHSGNLLCSWWNVDQMAYIPLLSQTWEATLPPPPAGYTLSKGH